VWSMLPSSLLFPGGESSLCSMIAAFNDSLCSMIGACGDVQSKFLSSLLFRKEKVA
jgi:hypothetical protein